MTSWFGRMGLAAVVSLWALAANAAPFMIVGNDEKVTWDDEGKPVLSPAGRDSVLIVDLANPEDPKIVANLPLKNSIVGPPVNLAITPDERLAIVANSVSWIQDGSSWKPQPDTKLYVFNLQTSPPSQVGKITDTGKKLKLHGQPASMRGRAQ